MADSRYNVKFGHFSSYEVLMKKIQAGTIDFNDMCFVDQPDGTAEFYLIGSDLVPIKVADGDMKIYSSLEDATEKINIDPTIRVGEIVSVLDGEKYRPYIVGGVRGSFTLSPLTDDIDSITPDDVNELFK